MTKTVALVAEQNGSFHVRTMDEQGVEQIVAWDDNLEICLQRAAEQLGPLTLPLSTEIVRDLRRDPP